MTEQQKRAKYGGLIARVASKSDPTKTYDIRSKNGIHSCNCKGFIFNKSCKHVNAYVSDVPPWLDESTTFKEPKRLVTKTVPDRDVWDDPLTSMIQLKLLAWFGVDGKDNTRIKSLAKLLADDVRKIVNVPAKVAEPEPVAKPVRFILIED